MYKKIALSFQILQKLCRLFTNVIIRFLLGDHEEHLEKSRIIFKDIEKAKVQVETFEGVLMEAFFVLTKFYKIPKNDVINDLKVSFQKKNIWI